MSAAQYWTITASTKLMRKTDVAVPHAGMGLLNGMVLESN
jgi:hypothetical protein